MRQCATEKRKDTWTSGTQQRPEIDPHTYGRFNGIIRHLFEKKMKLNIVLVEPEIPSNTGNISRTCSVIDAALHLVHPLGFDIDEKAVRRAGI